MRSIATWARSYMSLRASPDVQVSRLRVVSVTSAAISMSRTTNATRSSISVMPAGMRRPAEGRAPAEAFPPSPPDFRSAVFMVQRLDGAVVFDLDLLDLGGPLPRLGAARILRVEGSGLVLDV